jgi:hypothetical protein
MVQSPGAILAEAALDAAFHWIVAISHAMFNDRNLHDSL